MFIKLRKKLWLPIKYKLTHMKKVREIEYRPPKDVYKRIKEEKRFLLHAEKINDPKAIIVHSERLNTLNWITNGSAEN